MKYVRCSQLFSLVVLYTLLLSPLFLPAMVQSIDDDVYVYLGKELSNISHVISCIRNLDDNKNSPLDEFHAHIENGFFLAPYNNVLEVLEYASNLLQSNRNKLSLDQ